ncbi:MAG TPA: hypothetical protein VNX29_12950 [Kaistia sp.]|nr:hypothetical protein [Kaistia sp.]
MRLTAGGIHLPGEAALFINLEPTGRGEVRRLRPVVRQGRAAARRLAPDLPLAGDEHAERLNASRAIGFESIGALRVFVRD